MHPPRDALVTASENGRRLFVAVSEVHSDDLALNVSSDLHNTIGRSRMTTIATPLGTTAQPAHRGWHRLRRDRQALVCAAILLVFVAAAILAPLLCRLLGVDTERHIQLLSIDNVGFPTGRFGGMSGDHPLGVEPQSGRDLLALLLYGARNSLLIAAGATLVNMVLGVVFGVIAGYAGGWSDSVISRALEVLIAFPVLLFSVALLAVLGNVGSVGPVHGNGLRIAILILVIGFFGFPYTARLLRSQVLSLRQREFVASAKVLGASPLRIVAQEILPNLTGPIIVVTSLTVPAAILAEAGLSFLGVGITPPATSWGQLLGAASRVFVVDPAYLFFPGITLIVTVLALNLLGDSVRDAFDPRRSGS